jgi:hypothetical protein
VVKILPVKSENEGNGAANAVEDGRLPTHAADGVRPLSESPTATLAEASLSPNGVVVRGDLMWMQSDLDESMSFARATAAAAACRAGGYGDWRLPSAFEMQSLYDPTHSHDIQFLDDFRDRRPTVAKIHVVSPFRLRMPLYWTTSEGRHDDTAWNFDFRTGEPLQMSQGRGYCGVLLVRRAR